MDDLNGLDWSATSKTTRTAPAGSGNYYPSLRPTPPPQLSGRNTPLSTHTSGASKPSSFGPAKSSTQDSFANLVSFGSSKKSTLSLQEQQEKLLAERRQREEEKRKHLDAQFGSLQSWNGVGNNGNPPNKSFTSPFAQVPSPARNGSPAVAGADDDLFAAFNKDTKVDNASFYPPPSIPSSRTTTPGFGGNAMDLSNPQAWEKSIKPSSGIDLGDDDDPFGLGTMKVSSSTPIPVSTVDDDDDDFLGDLGRPVEEVRRPSPNPSPKPPKQAATPIVDSEPESDDPWDKAVAELVDMGFSGEQSRRALTESGAGLDIQAAVGWILKNAHQQAKQKQKGQGPNVSDEQPREVRRGASSRNNTPTWMQEDSQQPRRDESKSPANGAADLSKTAAAVGSNLLKSANSFWKTSQKKVQKAVNEFQGEADTTQPKWMREAAEREQEERRAASSLNGRREKERAQEVTDEALMLECGIRPQPRKSKSNEQRPPKANLTRDPSPALSRPLPERSTPVPRWQQSSPADPRSRVSKQAIEEQSAQAYVSPSRRKKTPQPLQPEPDLFSPAPSAQAVRPTPLATSRSATRVSPLPSKPSTPIPTRPKAPQRNVPHLSPIALQSSTQHRLAGTTHFKRGDYASAHASYSASLSALPASHPITIILLCNRALTGLKTGVPREAVADADSALTLIGPSLGHDEFIDLGPGEGGGQKDMKEFWGKALMRKAEALEQMEKWGEANLVWKACVEANVGGATATQGRTRCEKSLAPKAAPARPTPRPKRKVTKSAASDFAPSAPDSAAVSRLRAANIAAEKADDEKFALADQVDARIEAWRGGKRDNLRALLGSLDTVMWEGSGWKKIGMSDLIVLGKVKINYMKAIGKCHPDKVYHFLLLCLISYFRC